MRPPAGPGPGDLLGGRYILLRTIGEGGMATVFEARDAVTGDQVAVKVLHPIHRGRAEIRSRFEFEARLTEGLEHPNIVSVRSSGETPEGVPYLVMEYLAGESLYDCLRREGALCVSRAVSIVLQACRGLSAAHLLGIVHRDIKPDNLFLCRQEDSTDVVKVIDFGIAKVENEANDEGNCLLGTPDYMCPEQLQAPATVDCRADVYALGAVLFELLSGQRPHAGASSLGTLDCLLTKKPPAPIAMLCPTLPDGLASVVHRALAFDPLGRYATIGDLAENLERYERPQLLMASAKEEMSTCATTFS